MKDWTLLKAFILLFLVALFGASMAVWSRRNDIVIKTDSTPQVEYQEKVIDGCQYFVTRSYQSYWHLTHKGNCTNVIHKAYTPLEI